MKQKALVYIFASATEGLVGLQQKVFEVRKHNKVVNSSSAYKRFSRKAGYQLVESVIEIEIQEDDDLKLLHDKLQTSQSTLLMVEGELRIEPNLPLPHPLMLLDVFVLKMAAECAPYWEHRVKQQTLQALSNQNSTQDPVEFLTQGSALINV